MTNKLKLNLYQRVHIKHSKTLCNIGTIVKVEILYTVKQDDGWAFTHTENEIEAIK